MLCEVHWHLHGTFMCLRELGFQTKKIRFIETRIRVIMCKTSKNMPASKNLSTHRTSDISMSDLPRYTCSIKLRQCVPFGTNLETANVSCSLKACKIFSEAFLLFSKTVVLPSDRGRPFASKVIDCALIGHAATAIQMSKLYKTELRSFHTTSNIYASMYYMHH